MKNKSGFTLIELMVIFAVAAVVLTPFTMLMVSSLRNTNDLQRSINADQDTQGTLIVLNEAIRANDFDDVSLITNYFGHGEALRVDDRVFLLKTPNYVTQTYDGSTENTSSENVLSGFIDHVDYTLTTDELNIEFHIDVDDDGTVDDVFPYRISRRN